MDKCLLITLSGTFPSVFIHDFIQKHANKLRIEGMVKVFDGSVKITACGNKEAVDSFVDLLHKGHAKIIPDYVEIEPFLRDKDYRGVFRVIE